MSVTPDNAPIRPAYIRDAATGLFYRLAVQGLPGSGSEGGVSDHGLLVGLGDDDHTQYHNDARGDARYVNVTGDYMSGPLITSTLFTNQGSSGAAATPGNPTSLKFGWAGTQDYGHAIQTVHNGGDAGFNAIDIVLWKPGDLTAGPPSNFVLTIGGAGITARVPLTLPANPTAPLHAATKQYVDGKAVVLPPETDANFNTYYGGGTPADLTGSNNSAFGQSAMAYLSTGESNMAIGTYALHHVNTGGLNVGIGNTALFGVTSGAQNVGIGHAAGHSNIATTTQNFQTFIGAGAEQYATGSGDNATSIGHGARAHTQATAIGASTEARGIRSVAIGYGAVASFDNQVVLGSPSEWVYVPGSITAGGFITLNADPTNPLHAATKQYVDGRAVVLPPETDGRRNTMYGAGVPDSPGGADNSAFGNEALQRVTNGSYNMAFGSYAANKTTSGSNNLAIGYAALLESLTGGGNVAMGSNALQWALTDGNVGIGAGADVYTQASTNVTAIGGAAKAHTRATALGMNASARGIQSVALGYGAVAEYDNQIMLGTPAEQVSIPGSLTVSSQLMASGLLLAMDEAQFSKTLKFTANTSADRKIYWQMADAALFVESAGFSFMDGGSTMFKTVSVGTPTNDSHAATKLYVDSKPATLPPESEANGNTGYGLNTHSAPPTGGQNSAFGRLSQNNLTTGTNNTAFGYNSLAQVTTGSHNTALGHDTLKALIAATYNVAVGRSALGQHISGNNNTAVGLSALQMSTTGANNTAVGYTALQTPGGTTANGTTTATDQTAVGYQTGATTPGTGNNITAIGARAVAHTQATALGSQAKAQGIKSTAIGYGAIATLDNQIMLGTATERVDILGTLYVQGVQVTSLIATLEARIAALEAA